MPLRECLEKHTHREYLMWMAYLEEEFQTPSRTDYYLMQIAAVLKSLFSKKQFHVSDFRLDLRPKESQPSRPKESPEATKRRWMNFLGVGKGKPNGRRNRN